MAYLHPTYSPPCLQQNGIDNDAIQPDECAYPGLYVLDLPKIIQ